MSAKTPSSGLRPVTVWRVICTDGSCSHFRTGTKAEQYAIKLGTKALDVLPVIVHRSKDGIVAALNEAGKRK